MKNFALWASTIFIAVTGFCADPIGSVVAVEGELKAVNTIRKTKILQVNDDIFLGDTLITDDTARGQIKFTDGTLVLLIPGSQFTVDAYTMAQVGSDRFTSKLSRGGTRISTGLIAKKNPENFELRTANATIGVRGTVFESRMYDGNLYVGSSSGNLQVKNNGGSLDIGADNSSQFASVSSSGATPEALAARPEALSLSNFELPAGGATFPTASGAIAGQTIAANGFAWGPAVGGLTVIGTVVGVVVAAATQSLSTFSHSGSPSQSSFSHSGSNSQPSRQ